MKLYHGTAATLLGVIRERGIDPRGEESGNWPGLPSRDGYTYLTAANPLPYAYRATAAGGSVGLVLEIDGSQLESSTLRPDEDYLGQLAIIGQTADRAELLDRTRRADPSEQRDLWRDSLSRIGTVAVEGAVPSSTIIRYALVDFSKLRAEGGLYLDLRLISPLEGSVHIERYREQEAIVREILSALLGGTSSPYWPFPPGLGVEVRDW